MSDERMKRILERQRLHEEKLRQKEQANCETLKRKQEEQKKKEFEATLGKQQWGKDSEGKWIMLNDKNLVVDYDPVKPPRDIIHANTKQGNQVEIDSAKCRWVKEEGTWEIADEKRTNVRVHTSKEFHCYKTKITATEIPKENYERLNLREALTRNVDRNLAIDMLEVIIVNYFITSQISTQNAILRDILFLSRSLTRSLPLEYMDASSLNRILFQIRKIGEEEAHLPPDLKFKRPKYIECIENTEEAFALTNKVIADYKELISKFTEDEIEDSIILSMPDEVMLHIFSFLPTLFDLYCCSLVSKNWNRISNDGSLFYAHVVKEYQFTKYSPDINWKLKMRQIVDRKLQKSRGGISICLSCNSLYWELNNNTCAYGRTHYGNTVELKDVFRALQIAPP